MPDATHHVALANGLQLTLRHAPRLKRAAAALRVHAGSHDAPAKWPGMAHFLEHLFFLGTTRFPLEDGLMRYVQSLGGQVNASTRERTTDFFFEVPPAALAGGLERLCQMLAEPDLGIERQRREREVIHAEFIAWSRNAQAQQQFALLQSAAPQHPLSGFHAGNRFTLALQDPAFQQALGLFHQRFYQGGQITLSLCGPQPLEALERLGRQFGSLFPTGGRVAQALPPPLLAVEQPLTFAHERLPEGAEQALGLLIDLLDDSRPGGWLGALRQRGWLQRCKAEPLYAFAGQMLWHIDLQLGTDACKDEAIALLHGWFGFIRQTDLAQLNAQFGQLQRSREWAASPLELARRDSSGQPFAALDEQGLNALKALLASLPGGEQGHWQIPVADPLLTAESSPTQAPLPEALALSDLLPAARQYAALSLRWHLPSRLRRGFFPILCRALRPLQERAERAALHLQFSEAGEYWQLRCAGQPSAVIHAVDEALAILNAPSPDSWQAQPSPEPALIPIRALLKQLPDAILASNPEPLPPCTLDQQRLDQVLQNARWQGLALGFENTAPLGSVLSNCPGQAAAATALPLWKGRRWVDAGVAGSENALLLFCPVPANQHASGRLLAHLLQGPVYQRLRVELQLGYAVFSAFRQIEGCGGLLFGVQSPHASHADILAHLQPLLSQGVVLDSTAQHALAEQFVEPAMANAEVAEWAWQTYLATQPDRLTDLHRSILMTRQADLDALLGSLLGPDAPWLCLANAAAPDPSWQ
jgi:coenzyme PQQ biosynthesis probable peptidase PqqF